MPSSPLFRLVLIWLFAAVLVGCSDDGTASHELPPVIPETGGSGGTGGAPPVAGGSGGVGGSPVVAGAAGISGTAGEGGNAGELSTAGNAGVVASAGASGGAGETGVAGGGGAAGSAGSASAECTPGLAQCNGLIPQTCDQDGFWQDGPACDYVCSAGSCIGECAPGSGQCDGLVPQTCDGNGRWQDGGACPFACSAGACAGVCVPATQQCSGVTPQTCDVSGQWQDGTDCPFVCSGGACTGECVPGSQQCGGLVPQFCDPGGVWQAAGAACPFACSAGACTGLCVPTSQQCSGLVPQTCDALGQWQDGAACPFACAGGACTGSCVPASQQCNGLVPQTCDAGGAWQDSGAACPFVCTAGACTGSCVPGAQQCSGLVPQLCDAAGIWQDAGPACPNLCSAGVCTGACTPTTQQCNGLIPQTCDGGGQWQDAAPCQYACDAGGCTGECVPGSQQCTGLVPQTCDADGWWQDGTTCAFVCAGGSCTGECTPGAQQCSGLVPELCDAGGWWQAAGAACSYVCSAGACSGECVPGSQQCTGLLPQTCGADGWWQDGSTCPFVCSGGSCTGECVPTSQQCSGLQPETCDVDGWWQAATACSYVCAGGACSGECVPGTQQCSGLQPETCDVDGWWQAATACQFVCSAGACSGECTPTTQRCSGLQPELCDAGGWWQAAGAACDYVCTTGTCTGECVPGSLQCSGLTPQTCNSAGFWQDGSACPDSCVDGVCVIVVPDHIIDDLEDDDALIYPNAGRLGEWYTYNDGTSGGTQGPDLVSDMLPMSAPGRASSYAVRTWGSGFTDWGAGVGTNLDDDLTTRRAYDAASHGFTGVRFWARAETGTLDVRFNALDVQTDPAGGQCTACYDHFGDSVTLTTSWQQFEYFWDQLTQQDWGDQFAEVDSSAIYALQWQADQSIDFDFWLDDVEFLTGAGVCTPGEQRCTGLTPQNCDGSGRWVDGAPCPYVCASGSCTGECVPGSLQCSGLQPQSCDVDGWWQSGTACPISCFNGVCTGGTCDVPLRPFGIHGDYASGAIRPSNRTQPQLDQAVRDMYDDWKSRYLVAGCGSGRYYVYAQTDGSNATVSEAHGYGMLTTVLMAGHDPAAQDIFDGLYHFFRDHPSDVSDDLLAWYQNTSCNSANGRDTATDGDLDIAMALLMADRQWGSCRDVDYLAEALKVIAAAKSIDIHSSMTHPMLGSWAVWSMDDGSRPSDYLLSHFASFAAQTGDNDWTTLNNNLLNTVDRIQTVYSPATGLLPDFVVDSDGTPDPAWGWYLEGQWDGDYYYNAGRVPWRLATHYLVTGDARTKTALDRMNTWIRSTTGGDASNIRPGYTLSGSAIGGNWETMFFTAPFGASAAVDSANQAWLNSVWSRVEAFSPELYYEDSIKLLSAIVMTGNWWSPEQTL